MNMEDYSEDGGAAGGASGTRRGLADGPLEASSAPTPPPCQPNMAVRLQQAGEALLLATSPLNAS